MTKEDIANKHAPGTAKSHIDAMHHYMEGGMSFEESTQQSKPRATQPLHTTRTSEVVATLFGERTWLRH